MRAITLSSNHNVQNALVGYFLHLSHFPTDYEGATQEAAYDLEESNAEEFKAALRKASKCMYDFYNEGLPAVIGAEEIRNHGFGK